MIRDPEAFTPAEAQAVADDMNNDRHWGAAPLPCWCSLRHPPGAVGTVSPPWENELPGAGLPAAPGPGVPARMASGAVRAHCPPADDITHPPMSSAGAVSPVSPSPCGTGASGDDALEAEPHALPAPGTGTERRNPDSPPEAPVSGGDAALPLLVSPSSGGSAAQAPGHGTARLGLPGPGTSPGGAAAQPGAVVPPGTTPLEKWRKALAEQAKARRQGRGKHRKAPEYGPGMNRRQPPGGAS